MKVSIKTTVFWAIFVLASTRLGFGATIDVDEEIREVQKNVESLEDELLELELSVESLDELSGRLDGELREHEQEFQEALREVIVPLLSWPEKIFTTRADSWVELDRTRFVLEELQERLVREPLNLMAERELRLREIAQLRDELTETQDQLQSQESLLDLQLEELRMLRERQGKTVRHATGETKNVSGE